MKDNGSYMTAILFLLVLGAIFFMFTHEQLAQMGADKQIKAIRLCFDNKLLVSLVLGLIIGLFAGYSLQKVFYARGQQQQMQEKHKEMQRLSQENQTFIEKIAEQQKNLSILSEENEELEAELEFSSDKVIKLEDEIELLKSKMRELSEGT